MSLSRGLRELRGKLGLRPLSARWDGLSGCPVCGHVADGTGERDRTGDRSERTGQPDDRTGQPEVTGQDRGQLPGPDNHAGPDTGQAVRLLTDVRRTVLEGEVKVPTATVLDRLTEADPDRYRRASVTALGARLRELGIGRHQMHEIGVLGERRNLSALSVAEVEETLDRLDPDRCQRGEL